MIADREIPHLITKTMNRRVNWSNQMVTLLYCENRIQFYCFHLEYHVVTIASCGGISRGKQKQNDDSTCSFSGVGFDSRASHIRYLFTLHHADDDDDDDVPIIIIFETILFETINTVLWVAILTKRI